MLNFLTTYMPVIAFEFILLANFGLFGKRGIFRRAVLPQPRLSAITAVAAFIALPFMTIKLLPNITEASDVEIPWIVIFNVLPAGALLLAHLAYDRGYFPSKVE